MPGRLPVELLGVNVRQLRSLSEFPISTGDFFKENIKSAVAEDFPTLLLQEARELEKAGRTLEETETGGARFREKPRLSPDAVRARAEASGVTLDTVPESGYTPEQVDLLVERRTEEAIRNSRLSRYDPNAVESGLALGARLAVSVLDPINLGTAFFPVFGEARYGAIIANAVRQSRGAKALEQATSAAAVSRIGQREANRILLGQLSKSKRAVLRAKVGAVEGLAGAAAVEPLIAGFRRQLLDDYTFNDSLINIAFGGVLGASLHAGGGLAVDPLRLRSVEQARQRLVDEGLIPSARGPETPTTEPFVPPDRTFFEDAQTVAPETIPPEAREGIGRRAAAEPPPDTTLRAETRGEAPEPAVPPLARRDTDAPQFIEEARNIVGERARIDEKERAGGELTPEERTFRQELEQAGSVADYARELTGLRQLTPDLRRAADVIEQTPARRPNARARQQATEDRLLIEALESGREPEFINERLGQAARRIRQIDERIAKEEQRLARTPQAARRAKQPRENRIQRLRDERQAAVDETRIAKERLHALGEDPSSARNIYTRLSPETRQAVTQVSLARLAQGRYPDVEALMALDPGAQLSSAPDAIAKTAQRANDPSGVISADPEASIRTDEVLKARSDLLGVGEPDAIERVLEGDIEDLQAYDTYADEFEGYNDVELTPEQADAGIARAERDALAARALVSCGVV